MWCCFLFVLFLDFFLVTHYLTIFTKSYLRNTQNIQSPLQTVNVLTTDRLTVLVSSFGEDSFGFTVWVLVDSCSISVHVFVPMKNRQGSSHPARINTEEYSIMKHIQGVVERLNMYPWRRYNSAGICIPVWCRASIKSFSTTGDVRISLLGS